MKTHVVKTGSRLHFGLIIGGEPGALQFSGIGTMIDSPGWTLRVSLAEGDGVTVIPHESLSVEDLPDVERYLAALRNPGSLPAIRIEISQAIPRHAGLGSGTQFALALGSAIWSLVEREPAWNEQLARDMLQRGDRSRVGSAGFMWGGFIHHCAKSGEPERVRFPEQWRWLLVRPGAVQGIHGDREAHAFQNINPMPPAIRDRLTRLITEAIVPAAEVGDFDAFATALGRYGREIGAFYASYQDGIMADPQMLALADSLEADGFAGAAQSSWGPSIAVPARNEAHARAIRDRVESHPNAAQWQIEVCRQFRPRGPQGDGE